MRIVAQFSVALVGLYLLLMWKEPALVLVAFIWLPFLLVPVAWYVVFDRHREPTLDLEPLLLELRFIRNAIQELGTKAAPPTASARR